MIDREFRVGDRVTCNIYGLGKIIEMDKEYYCVIVLFKNNIIKYYNIGGKLDSVSKRTLFILPPIKPTKQQVKEKFKQLLDEVGEVEFVEGEYNYYLNAYFENGKCYFNLSYNTYENSFNRKYITKENIDKIVEEMNKFIKGE